MNLSLKKIKCIPILMLTLTSAITTFSFMSTVKAEVKIISLTPTSGYVYTNVTLTANITTTDGQYQIFFDGNWLFNGTATGNSVNTSITIPPAPAGSHNITIVDVSSGENDTVTFEVLTLYILEIIPLEFPTQQRQEGDIAEILVNVTGGEPDKLYCIANITVQTPTNATHVNLLNITLSEDGSGNAIIKYPDDFRSDNPNANTNFTGEYKVFFNETLATPKNFTIGLTNSTEYHRFQVVDIKAAGYAPGENVTITITGKDIHHSENWTVDDMGIIHYINWTVPSNASIGTYTINITSLSGETMKNPPDVQDFTVPGFDVNVTARNLAEEPVPEVTIQIFENETWVANATSDSPTVKLEIGNYTVEAYFKERKVGESWVNVTEAASFDVPCNLTNLMVRVLAVVNGAEICVPEVKLFLSPENLTLTPNLTTNITGIAVFHHLLIDVSYTLNASRYDTQFNTTTLYGLLSDGNLIAWFNLNITCPNYTLQVNVTNPNANNQPINDALVKVQEIMGGVYFEKTTMDGTAVFDAPLGMYNVQVYARGIKLNETIVNLNETFVNVSFSCKFYGLNVRVQVVDYFGQPISNANVTLSHAGLQNWSLTKSDGIAEFPDTIGGNLQVAVCLPGQLQPYVVSPLYIDSSKTVQIKIERYTVLAGFLVETSQLVIAIIIVVSVLLFISIEVYIRKRFKPKTSQSES